jgi:hypothetical protein
VKFKNPLSVSIGRKSDIMKAKVINPSIFQGKISGKLMEIDSEFQTEIPK